jgi:hypothetical protein
MKEEINQLMEIIAKRFPFDENHYPELRGASEKERLLFAVRHSALHFAKISGKIAAVSEDMDHGKDMHTPDAKTYVTKTLIDVLRLAELLGMTEKDIIEAIEKKCGGHENTKK